MNVKSVLRILLLFIIIASNIGCDRVSKVIVRDEIAHNETIKLLGNHFTLTRVENTGAFLSMGNSLPEPLRVILLVVLPILVLVITIIYFFKRVTISAWSYIALGFMIGGGIGNLYDRIIYGSVTDFMHIDFGLFQTGIFNFADVSIMTGMFIILADIIFNKKKMLHYGS